MKILITGSREFNNKELMLETFNQYEGHISEFIHGGVSGADSLAEELSKEYDIPSTIIRPVL